MPNPSFEEQSTCPDDFSQIYKATGWINFQGSPDLISQCGTNSVSSPNHGTGFQYPASGDSYVSMATYSLSGHQAGMIIREYIGAQLTTALVKDTQYYVSMKISPGFRNQCYNAFTNNMSILFTTYRLDSMIPQTLNSSHLRCNQVVTDTSSWLTIKGSFVADSNYNHLVVGNLYDDSNTLIDTTIAYQNGWCIDLAYCFIDDICVSTDSVFAYSYSYIGVNEVNSKTKNSIYPNPCKNYVVVEIQPNQDTEVSIINFFGETKYYKKSNDSKTIINTSQMEAGVYFIKIKSRSEERTYKLIINP